MGDFLPAVSLGANRTAIAVSADGDRTCILLDNGMYCTTTTSMYVYMYHVCMYVKLHITAQSGPVILVILCHSH